MLRLNCAVFRVQSFVRLTSAQCDKPALRGGVFPQRAQGTCLGALESQGHSYATAHTCARF